MQLLGDDYHAIRIIAERSFREQAGFAHISMDPAAPPAERHHVLRTIFSRYLQLARSLGVRGASPRVLMDVNGMIYESKFNELFARRDERPVDLGE